MSPQVTAAIIAAAISGPALAASLWSARLQVSATRRKLRLDLYDRRHAIFTRLEDAIRQMIHTTTVRHSGSGSDLMAELFPIEQDFYLAQKDMRFLFDEDAIRAADALLTAVQNYAEVRAMFLDTPHLERPTRIDLTQQQRRMRLLIPGHQAMFGSEIARHLDFTKDTIDREAPKMADLETLASRVKANRKELEEDGSFAGPSGAA